MYVKDSSRHSAAEQSLEKTVLGSIPSHDKCNLPKFFEILLLTLRLYYPRVTLHDLRFTYIS